jgi:hypothetical protein
MFTDVLNKTGKCSSICPMLVKKINGEHDDKVVPSRRTKRAGIKKMIRKETKRAKIRRRFKPKNNWKNEKYTHRLNKISDTHHSDPVESRMTVQCTVATRATAYVTQVCARIPVSRTARR